MGHKTLWLPMLLGSAGFFSVTPATAQVASGQLWGMQTDQTEPEPEPSGPQVAPAYLWGMDMAQTDRGAVFSAADQETQFYQAPTPRAPAPSAPVVTINFFEADTAVLFRAFARQGVPVEDDRDPALNETAWSRDAVRTSAAGREFMANREERGSPDRQAAGLFAPTSVSYAPAVEDEALTVDILRQKSRLPLNSSASLFTRGVVPATLPMQLAVAPASRQRERVVSEEQAEGLFTQAVASNATVVKHEALTPDIFRLTISPSADSSELMLTQSSGAPPVPAMPIVEQSAVATLRPRRVNRGKQGVDLFQRAVLVFPPDAADEALTVRIGR